MSTTETTTTMIAPPVTEAEFIPRIDTKVAEDTPQIETSSKVITIEDIPATISILIGSSLWNELQISLTGRNDK